jgi:hypothetical protein
MLVQQPGSPGWPQQFRIFFSLSRLFLSSMRSFSRHGILTHKFEIKSRGLGFVISLTNSGYTGFSLIS